MARQSNHNHFFLLAFPAHGHLNPALELAKRLICTGAHVTFVTCMSAHQRLVENSASFPDGLNFKPLFNSVDVGFKSADDVDQYLKEMRQGGEAFSGLIEKAASEGRPVSCLVYTLLFPWTVEVAHKHHLFSAVLYVQPATVFDIYYYYLNGYRDVIVENINNPEYVIQLPGLPLLKNQDLPSPLQSSNPHPFMLRAFQEQFDILSQEKTTFWILFNTFDELESEAMHAIEKFKLRGIGPLIPNHVLDAEEPRNKSSVNDPKEYLKWLDSKEKASVVYVSFGTLAVLSDEQMEALARGLVDTGRPFLWVIIRGGVKESEEKAHLKYAEILGEEHRGLVVSWCSQVEVLNHDSVGCFVSHCGWNSTLEAVAMGVAVVAFPQWSDQGTNAKLIVDVWKMGLRVKPNEEGKIVHSEEIVRCLEQVMGSEEFKNNARKWKGLARKAVKEGGSSERNLQNFIEEIRQFYL